MAINAYMISKGFISKLDKLMRSIFFWRSKNIPVSNRKTKYDQHKLAPSKASPSAWTCSRIWHRNHKRGIFPRSKGELFLLIPFSNSCGYIASFTGFTSRTYKWTQPELQGRVWIVGFYFPFSPRRYRRADEAWAGARQRSGSREAVTGIQDLEQEPSLNRQEYQAPGWPPRSPPGERRTHPEAMQGKPSAGPKSWPLVSWETNGGQVAPARA